MWPNRRRLPPELHDALRAARRATGRERIRTFAWRFRRLGRRLLALVVGLLVLGGIATWQAGPWPSPNIAAWLAPGASQAPLPRVIYGEPSAAPSSQPGARFTLRATAVDGDTLAAGDLRLRLHAIDAPEMSQTCSRGGRPYACGEEARRAMARILGSGQVTCSGADHDRYGRRIARCTNAAGLDIAAALVAEGWAIAFRRFGEDYVPQEEEARRRGLGLWAGSFESPDEHRRRQRP
ncbi:thermonuclease family protein [Roseomonas sp. HF4]|uniref:thermonuclease family protein n=1 Tax=Roseomonas sp. HF4 TaxID=2562313 RepID=UPI0010C06EDE|nr:thermonuclease family protein [Roseomonas sp. HF4]